MPFGTGKDSGEEYSLDEITYTAKSGGLLDVEHDMAALAHYDAKYCKELFDRRAGGTDFPFGSGCGPRRSG